LALPLLRALGAQLLVAYAAAEDLTGTQLPPDRLDFLPMVFRSSRSNAGAGNRTNIA
jgi:hypothetical protein